MKSTSRLALVAVSACMVACAPQAEPERPVSWAHRIGLLRDIPYGDHPQQRLDAYVHGTHLGEPRWFHADSLARPTVIYVHGGGWMGGDKTAQPLWYEPYLERGYNVISLNYRMGRGTAPQAVEDVLAALDWLAGHAAPSGIDPERIALTGDSAGGHLATIAGLLYGRRADAGTEGAPRLRVRAVINWFGVSDIAAVEAYAARSLPDDNYPLEWVGSRDRLEAISRAWSPVHQVTAQAPPVLSIHGDADTLVPHTQSVALHATLDAAGVPNRLLTLPGGNHSGFTGAQWNLAFDAALRFLSEHGMPAPGSPVLSPGGG